MFSEDFEWYAATVERTVPMGGTRRPQVWVKFDEYGNSECVPLHRIELVEKRSVGGGGGGGSRRSRSRSRR